MPIKGPVKHPGANDPTDSNLEYESSKRGNHADLDDPHATVPHPPKKPKKPKREKDAGYKYK